MDVLAFVVSDNDASTQETDSSYNSLDDPARIGAAALANGKDNQRRANPHQAQRANAGWLAVKVAVKAKYDADQSRSTEPQDDVEGVHSNSLAKAPRKQKSG